MPDQSSFIRNIFHGLKKKLPRRRPENRLSFLQEKWLKHLPPNKLRSLPYKNGQLYFRNAWELIHGFTELITNEMYRFEADNDTPYIIDCGANIGLGTLYFKWLYPSAKIVAFEPDANNLELLNKNIASYGIRDVEIVPKAVWINDGYISFNASGSQSSRITDEKDNGENMKKVPCTRLWSMLQQPVDFLKIDIEGAEYEVMKDCEERLSNVKHIFVEYHGNITESFQLLEILQILHNTGFEYYIREAADNVPYPLIKRKQFHSFDQQLNIFGYRR
jgi:FkbM family methyltransferase